MSSPATPLANVIARAWAEDGYRQQLLDNPRDVLSTAGIELPDGIEIRVVEDTPTTRHFVLPTSAREGELDAATLEQIAGGVGTDPIGGE